MKETVEEALADGSDLAESARAIAVTWVFGQPSDPWPRPRLAKDSASSLACVALRQGSVGSSRADYTPLRCPQPITIRTPLPSRGGVGR